MDYLRWILLAIAIIVVIAIYLWSRSRNKSWQSSSPLDAANDVPSFGAQDDAAWQDGVGPVRVVGDNNVDDVLGELKAEKRNTLAEKHRQKQKAAEAAKQAAREQVPASPALPVEPRQSIEQPVAEEIPEVEEETAEDDDLIVIYLIADNKEQLKGEQILSAAVASRLEHGDMKIFHRKDEHGEIQFSMADMKLPGWFDYDNMHKLRTRGVSFFMQAGLCSNPIRALDDMLLCAHSMASMLGARLCDQNKHLLNETVARSLREKAKAFSHSRA
ncbi:MAG: hypothetical protein EP315_02185 [Gammaproteobacteria bacterium]|nr:MAG: hypothetical protein EP315_02185 [Gammaproteobacteria bacterium]